MSETDPYKDGYAAAERFHTKRAATLLAEINTLATTLEARSEALNRVAAENEALRARLAKALADQEAP